MIHQASHFMTTAPQWHIIIKHLGKIMIICPILGWIMALGYRKYVVYNLLHASTPLPHHIQTTWRSNLLLVREGLYAMGVMIYYFSPILLLAYLLATPCHPHVAALNHSCEYTQYDISFITHALIFIACSFILPPITLGGTLTYYQLYVPWFQLSILLWVGIIILLMIMTYLIPLAFMQIGRRGYWRDALKIHYCIRLAIQYPSAYFQAWVHGLHLSLCAFTLGLRVGEGIVWSYLGIVYVFNQMIAQQFPQGCIHNVLPQEAYENSIVRLNVLIPKWWNIPP
jgi:hypothetical protein